MSKIDDSKNCCDDDDTVRKFGVLSKRSDDYERWLLEELESNNCSRILDVACGTGVDSLMLLDKGYDVVSSDDAEAMLQHARIERESRITEKHVANWDIRKANWLSLAHDLPGYGDFDAVLCLGNSMINLMDSTPTLDLYQRCFSNFKAMLKTGGILLVDHRNMDVMIDRGHPVNKNVYFKVDTIHKMESVLEEGTHGTGEPHVVHVTYHMATGKREDPYRENREGHEYITEANEVIERVTIPLCPVRVQKFGALLQEVFGETSEYKLFADLKPMGVVSEPAYYQHVIKKTSSN